MTSLRVCSLEYSRFSAFISQRGPKWSNAETRSLIHTWLLFMSFVQTFVQLEKPKKKDKKKKKTWVPGSLPDAHGHIAPTVFPVIYPTLFSGNSWYFSLSTPHSKPVHADSPDHPACTAPPA